MASGNSPSADQLKSIILNTKHPIILKALHIPFISSDFKTWLETYDEHDPGGATFQIGKQFYHDEPQWESGREKCTDSLKTMIECQRKDEWKYFGYKNIMEIPEKCRESVNFGFLGFPEIDSDISIWVGTSGAHTPCHFDTYGCNVVVQVFGIKSWFIFPPEAKLQSSRIPYEESSVYCRENFFSPNDLSQFEDVKNDCHHAILQPGDILIIPPKWWHYVENKENALSVNTWIPLESDVDDQISECLVKIMVSKFADDKLKTIILNPNEQPEMESFIKDDYLNTLNYLIESRNGDNTKRLKSSKYPSFFMPKNDYQQLIQRFDQHINHVRNIPWKIFTELLAENKLRYRPLTEKQQQNTKLSPSDRSSMILFNSICNPSVIDSVKKLYIQEIKKAH